MILIDSGVITAVEAEVKKKGDRVEVGGLLLGYRKVDDIHITNYTTPKKQDICKKYSFKRKDNAHQALAAFYWIRSGCKCDWVGEWHSHPVSSATPSTIDITTWRQQVSYRNARMFYIIIGSKSNWFGELSPTDTRPNQLHITCKNDRFILLG